MPPTLNKYVGSEMRVLPACGPVLKPNYELMHKMPKLKRQVLVEKKGCLTQEVGVPGRQRMSPQDHLQGAVWRESLLKGNVMGSVVRGQTCWYREGCVLGHRLGNGMSLSGVSGRLPAKFLKLGKILLEGDLEGES